MLYIVGTPIGNLQDISLRAARTLVSSDIILAEDTRSAQTLLHFIFDSFFPDKKKVFPKMISYYQEKELDKLPKVLDYLRQDNKVSIISESGMPIISDPGSMLVRAVIREEIPFTVVPGPSAVITSLIHAGSLSHEFMFIGFLPKKKARLTKALAQIAMIKTHVPNLNVVAFESPHRINATLSIVKEIMPNAQVSVARELTKKYEEVIRSSACNVDTKREYKGEITIVIS